MIFIFFNFYAYFLHLFSHYFLLIIPTKNFLPSSFLIHFSRTRPILYKHIYCNSGKSTNRLFDNITFSGNRTLHTIISYNTIFHSPPFMNKFIRTIFQLKPDCNKSSVSITLYTALLTPKKTLLCFSYRNDYTLMSSLLFPIFTICPFLNVRYSEEICTTRFRVPYVCNGCKTIGKCTLLKTIMMQNMHI